MITAFHGSPNLFESFRLDCAGDGTGIKFGFGVYLTEVEKSAVHYSQPRHMLEKAPDHYLYTVQIPDITPGNHLASALPVNESIVRRTEEKLGVTVPDKFKAQGKEFRKWLGRQLAGTDDKFLIEKAAAQFLDGIGVLFNVWPTAQSKPDGPRNIAVFNEANATIIKVEHIEIERQADKWVLTARHEIKK